MSIEGLGSSVAVSLALEVAQAEGVPHPAGGPSSPRQLRVLVVEDTYGSQMFARVALERLGHRVVVAADGEAAVRAFLESSFDVVLMDIHMPGMDGLEATRRIRACGRPGADRIPIIGVSALAAADDIEAAIASGMTRHLAKPVSVAALEAALAGLQAPQDGAGSGAAAATVPADPEPEGSAALVELARDLGADMMLVATRQFQHDADVLLARLASARQAGDCAGVQKAAHALKGLFRQFGVPALAQVAATLDRNPAAGSPEAAAPVSRILEAAPAAIARVIAQAEELARAAR